jgi:hypothetical protein
MLSRKSSLKRRNKSWMRSSEWRCYEHVNHAAERSFTSARIGLPQASVQGCLHLKSTSTHPPRRALRHNLSGPPTLSFPIHSHQSNPSTCLQKATSTARRPLQTRSCSSNAPPTLRMSSPVMAARAPSSQPTLTEIWTSLFLGMALPTRLWSCAFQSSLSYRLDARMADTS